MRVQVLEQKKRLTWRRSESGTGADAPLRWMLGDGEFFFLPSLATRRVPPAEPGSGKDKAGAERKTHGTGR
jgi:hypothetical protein